MRGTLRLILVLVAAAGPAACTAPPASPRPAARPMAALVMFPDHVYATGHPGASGHPGGTGGDAALAGDPGGAAWEGGRRDGSLGVRSGIGFGGWAVVETRTFDQRRTTNGRIGETSRTTTRILRRGSLVLP